MVREQGGGAEVVVLSTCNRTEIYRAVEVEDGFDAEVLQGWWAGACGVGRDHVAAVSVAARGEGAVRHLFGVAAGLESMVLGEPQVLGQVRAAYRRAEEEGTVGPILHRVFQQAIAASKRVRCETGIDSGRVSVGSIAVAYARRIFERFDDKTVVAIGAGQAAKLTLRHLVGVRPGRLWIVNRSARRARALAGSLGIEGGDGMFRGLGELDGLLVEADIVLSGTSSREPILTRALMEGVCARRRHRPIYVIDTAVPRDVEPSVGQIEDVYLYNMDDLQSVARQTHDERAGHAGRCRVLVDEAVRKCVLDVRHSELGRVVRHLRQKLHRLGDAENERTRRRLLALDSADRDGALRGLLSDHTRRLINKILHEPLSRLDPGRADEQLGFYAAAIRALFDVDHEPVGEGGGKDLERDGEMSGMSLSASEDRPKVRVTLDPARRKAARAG